MNHNIAALLTQSAERFPDQMAVAEALHSPATGRGRYRTITFRELDQTSDRLARGLERLGVPPGSRLALLVRPGVRFIALVFALFKAGQVSVLIDPGMGRRNLLGCLEAVRPAGFVAIPAVQAVCSLVRWRFPDVRHRVTIGRRWFWGGATWESLLGEAWSGPQMAEAQAATPAAIIFTTGSTGPPKGVLYRHGNFRTQVEELAGRYHMQAGEADLAAFPLFGLFNAALGLATVVPWMDASRPARVDPRRIVQAVGDWQVTQSFASPAVWDRVGTYCAEKGQKLSTLRRVLSAGAPVPARVLECLGGSIASSGEIHTPYGATEALPVASISAAEVLAETRQMTQAGGGVCVGRRFAQIEWRVIEISDGPLEGIQHCRPLPSGQIGELIVRGPAVTSEYVTCTKANGLAKIPDPSGNWHRMGDVGYLDNHERFWYCGRLTHRVVMAAHTLFTEQCEAIVANHPALRRAALVGIGPAGAQRPVLVGEPWDRSWTRTRARRAQLLREMAQLAAECPPTACIQEFLLHPRFPVDIRHNAKIFREKLAIWAAGRLPIAGPRRA